MNELQRLSFYFERGLCTRDEVRDWVDRQIRALDKLPSELLELTTMAHLDDVAIGRLLRALGGAALPADEARLELTVAATLFRRGSRTLRQTIDTLYRLLCHEEPGLNEVEVRRVSDLEVAYALAVEGIAGTLEEVRHELETFLADY